MRSEPNLTLAHRGNFDPTPRRQDSSCIVAAQQHHQGIDLLVIEHHAEAGGIREIRVRAVDEAPWHVPNPACFEGSKGWGER
jgi:hypothetical protein